MRNVCSRALVFALTVIGLAGHVFVASAQQEFELISFTNTWRYNNNQTDLGTGWRAFAFDDSGWPAGPGLLGSDDTVPLPYQVQHSLDINTSLDIGPGNLRTPTIYFRTHFTNQIAGNTLGLALVASNLVDDGCVIYLNGSEAARIRVTNATYSAYCPALGTEGQIDVTNIAPSLLRVGDNVVAVEVHQTSTNSSDLVFGMRLKLFRATALAITTQPQSQTIVDGQSVTFTAGVSGGPAFYQWQKNGANIPGATTGSTIQGSATSSYTITNVDFGHAGQYRVIASNALGSVTSTVATLTVIDDTVGPKLVSAIINNVTPQFPNGAGSNTINVIFNEALLNTLATAVDSPRNTNNYQLYRVGNPPTRLGISTVNYNAFLQALITVPANEPNWLPTADYYLVINNVSDLLGNRINPNSTIGVSRLITTNITQMSDVWDYYDCADPVCDPNSAAVYTNEAWTRTNFVESPFNWGSGPGIFARESGIPAVLCAGDQLNTTISFQLQPTLFRRTFRLPANTSSSGSLRLRFIFDDGMLIYLNGQPIYSNNVVGPITINSKASGAAVTEAVCTTNITVSVNNLLPGTNWLAAAVVQHAVTHEADTVFGFEMDLVSTRTGQAPTNFPAWPFSQSNPRITWVRQGTNYILSWPATNYGYALRYSTNIPVVPARNFWTNEANWRQVKDQSNPYTNSLPPNTGPRRFYQLFREQLN